MIRHIVMWKLDASYSSQEKIQLLGTLKEKLLQLKGKINELNSIAVHFNSEDAPELNFDIILDSSFDSMAALNAYQVHPEHLKVGEFVKSLRLQRACIDFEF